MSPLAVYQQQIDAKQIQTDSAQFAVMQQFEIVYQQLLAERCRQQKLFSWFYPHKYIKGIYLCGSVGIGKTFMMDCFYNALPFPNKLRKHFNAFMLDIHTELTQLSGIKNPLAIIAKKIAQQYMILFFDEFHVSDITDAMILGRLLQHLFAEGVTLIATSNSLPDNLYKNGLQRDLFVPAIEAIKEHTQLIVMESDKDYRVQHLENAGVYYYPLNQLSTMNMQKCFDVLVGNEPFNQDRMDLNGRSIEVIAKSEHVLWIDFHNICYTPRSYLDYLAIADKFSTVLISNIPIIDSTQNDVITLFISLVDIFYDRHIRLVISAQAPVRDLYPKGIKITEFTRTQSRLLEMQSQQYFSLK